MISSQKDSFLKAYKEGKNFIPIVKTRKEKDLQNLKERLQKN